MLTKFEPLGLKKVNHFNRYNNEMNTYQYTYWMGVSHFALAPFEPGLPTFGSMKEVQCTLTPKETPIQHERETQAVAEYIDEEVNLSGSFKELQISMSRKTKYLPKSFIPETGRFIGYKDYPQFKKPGGK